MEVEAPEQRLGGFWGEVDRRYNIQIAQRIVAGPVLDLGCGHGTLTEHLAAAGFECVGVDADREALALARSRFPEGRITEANASALPFPDGSFATVVLRDSLHHLVNEPDWDRIRAEVQRVMTPTARIVVLDPNVTALMRVARVLVRHRDEECTVARANAELDALGFGVRELAYSTIYTLPLSGGYVGPELVPRKWRRLQALLLGLEAGIERVLKRLGALRWVAWRYLIVADRK